MIQVSFKKCMVISAVLVLLPACQGAKEKRISRFEERAQKAYALALQQYSQELELADEIGLSSAPHEEAEKEFGKVTKQIIIDQHQVNGIASYPYSTYYVNLRSQKNSLEKYSKRVREMNHQLAGDIDNLVKKLEIILKQTHKAYYDELMKEQRDIAMSTDMARMSGTVFDYAGAVFSKPRI
jgi:hypothetical protein